MKLERIAAPAGVAADGAALTRRLEADGFDVLAWTDAPSTTYTPHAHGHDESLWCVRGLIVFEIDGAEYPPAPGDGLVLPRGTVPAARVGADGARYLIGQRAAR